MVRACSHGKDSWTETCTLWNPGSAYAFTVNTDAPDYPYPFTQLQGRWEVHETASGHVEIRMIFRFSYKRGIHRLMVHPVLKARFTKVCEELLDNWQGKIESERVAL